MLPILYEVEYGSVLGESEESMEEVEPETSVVTLTGSATRFGCH